MQLWIAVFSLAISLSFILYQIVLGTTLIGDPIDRRKMAGPFWCIIAVQSLAFLIGCLSIAFFQFGLR